MDISLLLLCSLIGMLGGMASMSFPRWWAACTLTGAITAFLAGTIVLTGQPGWSWKSDFLLGGTPLTLLLDAVSAFFLVLLSTVAAAGSIYAIRYWPDSTHPRTAPSGRLWWNAMITGMGLVLTAANGLHFLLGWELFAVSAYFLVSLERGNPQVRAAGWLYLAASHVGTLALFAFFASLAAQTGSWELGPMRDNVELAPLFWLAFLGFGIKAGVFPLHVWLPSAHANAPSHVSALLSGVALKIGIYGLVRFSGWLPTPPGAGWVMAGLGCTSAVLGVAFALGQHDLKRLLAYHSVENIGIILMGLGFATVALERDTPYWGTLALAGGLLHVWNHGLFKSLLFFGAGAVLHATGTRQMSRLGGLWRHMPWTAALFTLGSVAISGLPPLNGFVSEWLIYSGLLLAGMEWNDVAMAVIPAAVLLAVTGALALACFTKVCGVVFLGAPRSAPAERAHECGWGMRGAMLMLAAGCTLIGLFPAMFWQVLSRVAKDWSAVDMSSRAPDALYTLGLTHVALAVLGLAAGVGTIWFLRNRVRRSVTWDCGFSAPSARMQYTAGSFAGIINEWFAWILRPTVHEIRPTTFFPSAAQCASHTPETVLEHVVEPVGHKILRLADKASGFQHGRVQSYIFYLCVAILVLSAAAILSGRS
ncbi:MAG: NADH-quinone oxidoreductase subunit H [Desulfovibrionales bacterium]|nr:NADH-quinone oxidoreductase subunit H [Desulfovibrionales bacterium]